MNEELPEGWTETTLGTLLREPLRNGHSAKASPDGRGVRTLTLSAVTYGDFSDASTKMTIADPRKVSDLWLEPGDLLVERSNTPELVGTARLYRGPKEWAIFPDLVIRARVGTAALSGYIEARLQSHAVRKYYTEAAQGTAGSMPKIDQGAVERTPIPLAPLAEQRRITEKVEALLEQVNRAKGRLDRVPLILKRFRQAVLAAACSGELTREWRETSDRPSSASALIQGTPLVDADLAPVPEGWVWALMDQVAEIRGGIQKQPKRAPKKNAYPYLRVANVLRGRLNLDQIEQMELFGDEPETYRLKSGDILIVEGNGSLTEIGRSAVWHDEVPNCVHQNHIIRVRPRKCSSKFLDFYWNSPLGTAQVAVVAVTTSGLYSLSTRKIAGLPVPVAPLEEQAEIVRRVERLFALADTIERRVQAATARAEKLPQAILSKAFSGELVPTEAELARAEGRTYETAEQLLKRVAGGPQVEEATRQRGKAARRSVR